MKDINKPLREAYFPALQATSEAVYYMQAPDNLRGNRIVYSIDNGSPVAMKTGDLITVETRVTIYTEGVLYNDGDSCDVIAGKVYAALYPTPSFVLDLGADFQMVSTDLVSDRTDTFTLKDQVVAIDRTITFSHKIFVR